MSRARDLILKSLESFAKADEVIHHGRSYGTKDLKGDRALVGQYKTKSGKIKSPPKKEASREEMASDLVRYHMHHLGKHPGGPKQAIAIALKQAGQSKVSKGALVMKADKDEEYRSPATGDVEYKGARLSPQPPVGKACHGMSKMVGGPSVGAGGTKMPSGPSVGSGVPGVGKSETDKATPIEIPGSTMKAYLGFEKLKRKISSRGGARDPGAVAAAIGRKKYGKAEFQAMSRAGRKKSMGDEEEDVDKAYVGFEKLKRKIAARGGVSDPGAVAAAIGRKKYGKEAFQGMASSGKKAPSFSKETKKKAKKSMEKAADADKAYLGPAEMRGGKMVYGSEGKLAQQKQPGAPVGKPSVGGFTPDQPTTIQGTSFKPKTGAAPMPRLTQLTSSGGGKTGRSGPEVITSAPSMERERKVASITKAMEALMKKAHGGKGPAKTGTTPFDDFEDHGGKGPAMQGVFGAGDPAECHPGKGPAQRGPGERHEPGRPAGTAQHSAAVHEPGRPAGTAQHSAAVHEPGRPGMRKAEPGRPGMRKADDADKAYPLGEGPKMVGTGPKKTQIWLQPPAKEKKEETRKIDLGTAPMKKAVTAMSVPRMPRALAAQLDTWRSGSAVMTPGNSRYSGVVKPLILDNGAFISEVPEQVEKSTYSTCGLCGRTYMAKSFPDGCPSCSIHKSRTCPKGHLMSKSSDGSYRCSLCG